MASFTDDFERANGALGGNWSATQGSPVITGGAVGWTLGAWTTVDTTVSDGDYIETRAHIYWATSATSYAGPMVKSHSSHNGEYFARVFTVTGSNYLQLVRRDGTVNTVLAQSSALGTVPPYIYLTILWDHGHLTATYGNVTVEADDSTYATNVYGGLHGSSAGNVAADVQIIATTAVSLTVSPTIIGNYGSPTHLVFTGTGTNWTPGTPGSPTFTVDHGTLSDQLVGSTTDAGAIYDPGTYLGAVVFTDPSTGATATALVTSDPGVVPYAEDPWLTDDDGDLVHKTITLFPAEYLLTNQSPAITTGGQEPVYLTIPDALRDIWHAHFGNWEGTSPQVNNLLENLLIVLTGDSWPTITTYEPTRPTSIKEELEWVRDYIDGLRGDNQQSLGGVIDAIQGAPLQTLDSLSDQIAALSPGSNQDILDAIGAVRGYGNPDLTTILGVIDDLTAGSTVDLGDLSTAIAANQTALTAIGTAISTLSTTLTNGLQAILDAVAAIPTTGGTPGAPLWPGLENVTLGDAVNLQAQLSITAPMDGVRVLISSVDQGTLYYRYGDKLGYRRIGALAFFNDNGDLEVFQALNFEQAFYTPKTMLHAAGVKLFTQHVASGTIQPWVVNP